ncbi:hypothetical protein C7212DRAFT_341263 [Tuber magnatum]|uniref:Secreted protein n=1 Tax=Tuber magnatum TaxID=42249 RepID=A0A317T1G4_9PEZI|nr:hypothetical protein C7212DRAFT_341263 [Tuber magnatum]
MATSLLQIVPVVFVFSFIGGTPRCEICRCRRASTVERERKGAIEQESYRPTLRRPRQAWSKGYFLHEEYMGRIQKQFVLLLPRISLSIFAPRTFVGTVNSSHATLPSKRSTAPDGGQNGEKVQSGGKRAYRS